MHINFIHTRRSSADGAYVLQSNDERRDKKKNGRYKNVWNCHGQDRIQTGNLWQPKRVRERARKFKQGAQTLEDVKRC